MKAITCPQCGAIIKRVLFDESFAVCDFCEAKIVLPKNKENTLNFAAIDSSIYQPRRTNFPVWVIMLVVSIILLPIILSFIMGKTSSKADSPPNTPVTKTSPFTFKMPTPIKMPTVYPQINYQVSVKWSGSNDMEHFENPNIDTAKLPTSDEKELKKTIFANRSVQVKITINENGEVTEAKAVSGHLILKEAAENAARKTLFANRQKPTNRVLTYIFRLVTE
jgi:hypothetical protein